MAVRVAASRLLPGDAGVEICSTDGPIFQPGRSTRNLISSEDISRLYDGPGTRFTLNVSFDAAQRLATALC
jgi:hypothetical protein